MRQDKTCARERRAAPAALLMSLERRSYCWSYGGSRRTSCSVPAESNRNSSCGSAAAPEALCRECPGSGRRRPGLRKPRAGSGKGGGPPAWKALLNVKQWGSFIRQRCRDIGRFYLDFGVILSQISIDFCKFSCIFRGTCLRMPTPARIAEARIQTNNKIKIKHQK